MWFTLPLEPPRESSAIIPFGLKNADATYERAITIIFGDLLHKDTKCYVNDLVVIKI